MSDISTSWWRHQMETSSALLAICAGNSPVTCEFPAQRPVTRSFDVFFDLPLNKRLSKQLWGWWFQTPSCPLWRHCNDIYWGLNTLFNGLQTTQVHYLESMIESMINQFTNTFMRHQFNVTYFSNSITILRLWRTETSETAVVNISLRNHFAWITLS